MHQAQKCERHRNLECNGFIQRVEYNRHEDAALQRAAGNALTSSSQRAYRSSRIRQLVIRKRYDGFSLGRIITNVETPE